MGFSSLNWFLVFRMGGERQSVWAQGGNRGVRRRVVEDAGPKLLLGNVLLSPRPSELFVPLTVGVAGAPAQADMPVRFKGLSEYQRNFLWKKSYLSESCNSSMGRRHPWAGLRSDQLGITREPSFISKRRVPHHDPQISKSLEWNAATSENDVVLSPETEAPRTPESQEAEQTDVNQERLLAVEASRGPKRTRSHSADSRSEGASDIVENKEDIKANDVPANENVELKHSTKPLSENVDDRLNRLLQKKAGLTVVPSHNVLRNSEYQRQFVWKTPKQPAPAFAANQATDDHCCQIHHIY